MPVLSVAAFIKNFNATRGDGFYRYEIFRVGKTKLLVVKFFGGVLSGGIALLLGYMLFGIIAFFLFPSFQSYEVSPDLRQLLFLGNPPLFIFCKLIGVFLLGVMSTLPAILLSAFVRNIYVVLSLPYMVIYFYNSLLGRAIFSFVVADNFEAADWLYCLFPHSIVAIAFDFNAITMIFQAMLFLTTFSLFVYLLRKRVDCSE
jgi:hypothetical protein